MNHKRPFRLYREEKLTVRKGFGFSGGWTINDQNDLLARLFGLKKVNKV